MGKATDRSSEMIREWREEIETLPQLDYEAISDELERLLNVRPPAKIDEAALRSLIEVKARVSELSRLVTDHWRVRLVGLKNLTARLIYWSDVESWKAREGEAEQILASHWRMQTRIERLRDLANAAEQHVATLERVIMALYDGGEVATS